MKRLYILPMLAACFWWASQMNAQMTIEVVIDDGSSTTTCTDIFGAPDPQWGVNIENTGWVIYPSNGNCYEDTPNTQYTQGGYDCLDDLPAAIQVCFQSFENDGLFGCDITEDCLEEICMNFDVPQTAGGSFSYTLSLPGGQDSGGSVDFTINILGSPLTPPNDDICNAIDLGTLTPGSTLGDANLSDFFNFCGTSGGEPNPFDEGATWFNNVGVWFTFTTGAEPLSYVSFIANSDPENLGDSMNIQIALYSSDDQSCAGNFTMLNNAYKTNSWDEDMNHNCLEPNTTYYVLIDGVFDSFEETFGYFGLEIIGWDFEEGGDLRCDAEFLGTVPEGGSVDPGEPQTNRCATPFGEPFAQAFSKQKTVWYSFYPPSSGHVIIEATNLDPADFPPSTSAIDLELALYYSLNNTCSGIFLEEESVHDTASFDETLEVSCLDPNTQYWIMVDGEVFNRTGVFNLTVTDGGDDTPVFDQEVYFCGSGSITVGSNTYTTAGSYSDTLALPTGCDSIVNTTVIVLDEITPALTIINEASGFSISDGEMQADATGGLPPYTFLWSDNQTTQTATGLEGGANYCVTITDQAGCEADTCFIMPFDINIVPLLTGDTLDCNGDSDGVLTISAANGQPPYDFNWTHTSLSFSGNGSIPDNFEEIKLADLPAGNYSVTITDGILEVIDTVQILEPSPLELSLVDQTDASCFGFCDATAEVIATGGNGAYAYTWSDNQSGSTATGLCAGTVEVMVTDSLGCQTTLPVTITQPPEFIATVAVISDVTCFGGNDGEAAVTGTNGNAQSYLWSNMETTSSISGLTAGSYTVTVTNEDGCEDVESVEVTEPSAPVEVEIVVSEPIRCKGVASGILEAEVSGPGLNFTYSWSDNETNAVNTDLGPGTYTVTVTNDAGCEATDQFTLTEPPLIEYAFETTEVTCLTPPDAGTISLTDLSGGVGDFEFSFEGDTYDTLATWDGLFPGFYEVTIRDEIGCEIPVLIEVEGPEDVVVDLGADQLIDLGETVFLDGQTNILDALVTWSVQGDCENAICDAISFVPLENILVEVTVLDTATQCVGTDEVFIEVQKTRKLYVPNVFSPDYDGLNDYFTIFGDLGVVQVQQMAVFDRNGGQMYQNQNFQPGDEMAGWDGTRNGKEAQTGVYTYFFEVEFIDGVVEVFKGDVLLLR